MVVDIEKVRIILARKQLSMTQFFKEAHFSQSTVKRIKEGCTINTKTAGKLAAALGCDITELLA